MGIFSGLFKSRDKPQNRTAGSNYAFFFGGMTSGKAVTERSAMQMTAVYSCVHILSEAVAELPLHLYKYTDSGGKAMALDHPLFHLLYDEPNPEMSSFVFRETLMTHLLLWGNAYAQIIRNGKGEVMALYPLMPNRMEVNRDKNGKLYYLYSTQSDDAPTMKGSTVYLDPSEVLHIMSSIAQAESRNISENLTWGMRKRFANGKVTMPYGQFMGYRRGKDGTPEVVEAEADIVRTIFRRFLEGATPAMISRELNLAGISCPSRKSLLSENEAEIAKARKKTYR